MRPEAQSPAGVDLVAGLVAGALGLQGLRCLDVWFHLRTGQIIWESGAIPTADTLSHTRAGAAWITHEWLFELPLWAIWRLGGDSAMVGVQAGLAGLAFAVLARVCLAAGANGASALVAASVGAIVASTRFVARPHMASAVFTAVLLLACLRHRARPDRRIFLIIPLFALWANVHSGVVQGLFITALFAAEEAWQNRRLGPLAAAAALGGLASLLNPHGWNALWYPFFLIRSNDAGLFDIVELRPPEWPSGALILAGGVVLSLGIARNRLTFATAALAVVGVVLGVTRMRGSLDLALYGAPALALACTELTTRLPGAVATWVRSTRSAPAWFVVVTAGLLGTGYRPRVDVVPWAIPAGAMDFVERAALGGQMMNSHLFGGWLVWAHPERKVYFDGRNEVFISLFEETRTTPVAALAARYDLGYAVLDYPTDRDVREVDIPVDLNDVLLADPRWELVYFDDVARVYALDRPENREARMRHGYRYLRPGWSDFEYIRRYADSAEQAAGFAAEAQRAIAASPGAAMPRMHLVELLRLTGRVADALHEIEAISADDPFRVSRMGGLLLQAGRPAEARDALLTAVRVLPENPAVWSNLGLAELRLGNAPAAVAAVRRAISLDPDLFEARDNLALALKRQGDTAGAAAESAESASIRDRLARTHFEAGQQLLESGYAERAAVELERAAALAPRSANSQYLLGVAYNALEAWGLAEGHLSRALVLDPRHPYALLELARAQLGLARTAEARTSLLSFLAASPAPKWEAVARQTLAAASAEEAP